MNAQYAITLIEEEIEDTKSPSTSEAFEYLVEYIADIESKLKKLNKKHEKLSTAFDVVIERIK